MHTCSSPPLISAALSAASFASPTRTAILCRSDASQLVKNAGSSLSRLKPLGDSQSDSNTLLTHCVVNSDGAAATQAGPLRALSRARYPGSARERLIKLGYGQEPSAAIGASEDALFVGHGGESNSLTQPFFHTKERQACCAHCLGSASVCLQLTDSNLISLQSGHCSNEKNTAKFSPTAKEHRARLALLAREQVPRAGAPYHHHPYKLCGTLTHPFQASIPSFSSWIFPLEVLVHIVLAAHLSSWAFICPSNTTCCFGCARLQRPFWS